MIYITSPEQVQQCDAGARAFQLLCEENRNLAQWLWERSAQRWPVSFTYQLFVWQWLQPLPEQAYYAVYLSLEFLELVHRSKQQLGN